jgi:hypothetical protein
MRNDLKDLNRLIPMKDPTDFQRLCLVVAAMGKTTGTSKTGETIGEWLHPGRTDKTVAYTLQTKVLMRDITEQDVVMARASTFGVDAKTIVAKRDTNRPEKIGAYMSSTVAKRFEEIDERMLAMAKAAINQNEKLDAVLELLTKPAAPKSLDEAVADVIESNGNG